MNRNIKTLLSLRKRVGLPEIHLFNGFVDVARADTVEEVMTSIPPEYLPRFRDWIDRLMPSLDTLINLKSGPLSEHEKDTFRAIHDWLERHVNEPQPHEAADS